MINSNDDIDKGRANGTICKGISVIKLRTGTKLVPKIWDGRIINTVSVDDVEYIICQHYENTLATSKLFKLFPEPNSVKINLKLLGNIVTIGGIRITQFPVNSNIATTGHKLQGMTKDSLIVHSWNYSFSNWIYVVLSRVRTLSGLFMCKKLEENKQFVCDEDLLREEKRLESVERSFLHNLHFTYWK